MTDQAPATDPALDAVERIEDRARRSPSTYAQRAGHRDDADLIREALADRITPAEAQELLAWSRYLKEKGQGEWPYWPSESALIARLGRIADREADR